MAIPGGNDLENLLKMVSYLENSGMLQDFLLNRPEYVVGAEMARAIIRHERNNNANMRGLPAPQGFASPAYRPVMPMLAYPQQAPNQQAGGFYESQQPMGMGFVQPMGMGYPQQTVIGYTEEKKELLPPPSSTEITKPPTSIPGHVIQRIAAIPEPRNCPRPGENNMFYSPPPMQRAPRPQLVGTLEQRLAAIPVPAACPLGRPSMQNIQPRMMPALGHCHIPRTIHSHERARSKEYYIDPVAGGWSDGVGGHKVKPNDVASGRGRGLNNSTLDGAGGRKVRGHDED